MLFSFPFQFYVPIQILFPYFKSKVSERYHLMAEYALRFALVLFTCKFACETSTYKTLMGILSFVYWPASLPSTYSKRP